jgi:hypothetical protein
MKLLKLMSRKYPVEFQGANLVMKLTAPKSADEGATFTLRLIKPNVAVR